MIDDTRLVTRAQTGDARAFEVLVHKHGPLVYNLALRLVRDPLAAEDLAQEAFIRAWRALPDFRAESRLSTWLYRIVTNLCLNHLPLVAAELATLELDNCDDDLVALPYGGPGPDAVALSADTSAHLHRAMDELPAGFRLLLTLRYLQEMTYSEIAVVTGLPEGTVKSGIFRARGQLKVALLEFGIASPQKGVPATDGATPTSATASDTPSQARRLKALSEQFG